MAVLIRFKFTLVALVTLIGFAIASDSYWHPLPELWRQWLGYAPMNLLDLQWHRLLTSLTLTAGEWKFIASAVMLAFTVGIAESRYGTWQTAKLFFTSHLAVLVSLSLLVLVGARHFHWDLAVQLVESRDVGPSAGYYGCLGAVLTMLPRKAAVASMVGITFILVARLIVSLGRLPDDPSVVSADMAHLVALPLGSRLANRGYVRILGRTKEMIGAVSTADS